MPYRAKSFREIHSIKDRPRARPGFVKPIRDGLRKLLRKVKSCTNQQPPQRGGVVPNPVWVGSKWLLTFSRVPVTPGTPLENVFVNCVSIQVIRFIFFTLFLTNSLEKCQMKSFENINTLLSEMAH